MACTPPLGSLGSWNNGIVLIERMNTFLAMPDPFADSGAPLEPTPFVQVKDEQDDEKDEHISDREVFDLDGEAPHEQDEKDDEAIPKTAIPKTATQAPLCPLPPWRRRRADQLEPMGRTIPTTTPGRVTRRFGEPEEQSRRYARKQILTAGI